MQSYEDDFKQLSQDLTDAIYMRLAKRVHGFDKRYLFLMWLTPQDVKEFSEDIPGLHDRIRKSPVALPEALYKLAFESLSDTISMYRIVAAMTLLIQSKREDSI